MFKKLFGFGNKNNKDKKTESLDESPKAQEISEDEVIDSIEEAITSVSENSTQEYKIKTEDIENNNAFIPEDPSESFEMQTEKPKKKGFLERLKSGLLKTRDAMSSSIDNLINGKAKIDDDLYDELEEIMISADMGVDTTIKMIDRLRDTIEEKHIREPKMIKSELEQIMKEELKIKNSDNELNFEQGKQAIILIIGVNGVGKTTTIGKLAHNLQSEGRSVLLAAADTFRAAAIDQLTEWANRANVEIIAHNEGADPASVVFDAIKSQRAKNKDVLIIDTAGRLHNKKNLMNELEKINRIISREHPEATRETLLVLDATTGQNAIFQAKEFNNVTDISGIVLTKLDGTAKGGVVFPLQVEHNIPVKYIGVGEGIDNLEKFDSDKFVEALF
ncbi:MAG: signal recognition particle-docking protein FtsY [Tissierellia bacterium]|nr:signal recognition particle-docking protein FtsY [Tissierellia bacterium]